jgi:hypothetical protein
MTRSLSHAIRCVSEKCGHILNCFNVSNIFKTEYTLREALMGSGPVRDAQLTRRCVFIVSCGCGKCYIAKTDRPLEILVKEHRQSDATLAGDIKVIPTFAREDHTVVWKESKFLPIEANYTYSKYTRIYYLNPLFVKARISLSSGLTSFRGGSLQVISQSNLIMYENILPLGSIGRISLCILQEFLHRNYLFEF